MRRKSRVDVVIWFRTQVLWEPIFGSRDWLVGRASGNDGI